MQKFEPISLTDFLNQFSVIIFDLDGVILDSVGLKVQCMRQALSDFPAPQVEAFLQCFIREFGQSREHHFKNFYNLFLNDKSIDFQRFYQHYEPLYANGLKQHYADVALCDYAARLIPSLSHKDCYVATGTLTGEAGKVLTKKNLVDYFNGIYGAPQEKQSIVHDIIARHNLPAHQFLLIGDALHDQYCAFVNQIQFLFIERHAVMDKHQILKGSHMPFYMAESLSLHALVISSEQENQEYAN